MAVTITIIAEGLSRKRVTVIADSDLDTQGVITHGLEPLISNPEVKLTGILAAARLSGWVVISKSNTQIVIGKDTAAGSGSATAQVEVVIERPNSLVGPHT